jgi:hypothetical protein
MPDIATTQEEIIRDLESTVDGTVGSADVLQEQRRIAREAIVRIREIAAGAVRRVSTEGQAKQESAPSRDVEAEVRAIKARLGV